MAGKKPKRIINSASASKPTPKTVKKRQFFVLYYPSELNIAEEDVITVREELKTNIKAKAADLRIDLIIHSWGGDVYSAFKIIKTIREYCSEVYAIIPIRAVSAGTLITLGSDKIYLGNQSQLGPLDLPTEHPTIEGTRVSSIDCIQSLAYLEGILKSNAENRYRELRHDIGLGKKDSITLAYDIALKFVHPLSSKIDPIQTSKSSRDLEIAKLYGSELLKSYMLKNDPLRIKNSDKIITELVYNYPAHGFAIWFDEANRIGLEVDKAENYKDWDKVFKLVVRLRNNKRKALWHLTESQLKTWAK